MSDGVEDSTLTVKCEICGKIYPKGTVCCGVSKKNQVYLGREGHDDPTFDR